MSKAKFTDGASGDLNSSADWGGSGLTKREQACITLGVPETGDPELDELIIKSERKRIAAMAMQGLLSGGYCIDDPRDRLSDLPEEALDLANALLEELAE